MIGLIAAVVTVLAWGTWLAPSQNVPLRNQQARMFFVAAANLVLAAGAGLLHAPLVLRGAAFWLPFAGGLVWSVSGLCAFTATARLGTAKAFGTWAPLNIIVSLICGRIVFGEFSHPTPMQLLVLVAALAIMIGGVGLIVLAKGGTTASQSSRAVAVGWLGAIAAGVLWGVYFIPVKLSAVSLWVAALPLAIGIFAGSALLLLLAGGGLRLRSTGDYIRVTATGLLWSIGNFGMLVLVDEWGMGRGFTISQLSVVMNALVGIFWLKDPRPHTRGATLTLAGCALATLGGVIVGNLK